ncbi:hypothetical protein [Mesotoga sp.]|uniref:hypothetical protein n=1 Tax=Mesotoga sp. TaxID=2053577 RepID=UPI00345E2A09
MQKILKFVEKSKLVQDFKIHDFKTGKDFAYIKLEILFKNSSKVYIREFVNAKQRKYSFPLDCRHSDGDTVITRPIIKALELIRITFTLTKTFFLLNALIL